MSVNLLIAFHPFMARDPRDVETQSPSFPVEPFQGGMEEINKVLSRSGWTLCESSDSSLIVQQDGGTCSSRGGFYDAQTQNGATDFALKHSMLIDGAKMKVAYLVSGAHICPRSCAYCI